MSKKGWTTKTGVGGFSSARVTHHHWVLVHLLLAQIERFLLDGCLSFLLLLKVLKVLLVLSVAVAYKLV